MPGATPQMRLRCLTHVLGAITKRQRRAHRYLMTPAACTATRLVGDPPMWNTYVTCWPESSWNVIRSGAAQSQGTIVHLADPPPPPGGHPGRQSSHFKPLGVFLRPNHL